MAKAPGWMVYDGQHVVDGQLYACFRIRRWHPGYWLVVASDWWRRRRTDAK